MELTNKDRMGTRLLALNLRLYELNRDMEQSQLRVHQLESQLDDARLAGILGEDAGDAHAIHDVLSQERTALEHRKEAVDRVKEIQWKARVQHAVETFKQRQAAKAQPQE